MQAIVTKYLPPTEHRGARIKVSAQCGSKIYAWDYVDYSHAAAAKRFAVEKGWRGRWIGGGMPDGTGDCFVHATGANSPSFVVTDEDCEAK